MATPHRIRLAAPADTDAIVALWRGVLPQYDAPDQAHREPVASVRRKLAHGDGLFWVAELDGRVVGTIMAGYDGHRGWVYSLAVHPAVRRGGIGRALVEVAERALAARGCPKVNLQVLGANPDARAFWSRLGYAEDHVASFGKRAAPALAAVEAPFVPRQVTRTFVQALDAPPERVLPLLTADGERAWARGWDPDVVRRPETGHAGTVFVTAHGPAPALWWCTRFDEVALELAYVHVTPGSDAVDVAIRLEPGGDGRTRAHVRYTWTTLGRAGDAVLDRCDDDSWRAFMLEWQDELNLYLRAMADAGA